MTNTGDPIAAQKRFKATRPDLSNKETACLDRLIDEPKMERVYKKLALSDFGWELFFEAVSKLACSNFEEAKATRKKAFTRLGKIAKTARTLATQLREFEDDRGKSGRRRELNSFGPNDLHHPASVFNIYVSRLSVAWFSGISWVESLANIASDSSSLDKFGHSDRKAGLKTGKGNETKSVVSSFVASLREACEAYTELAPVRKLTRSYVAVLASIALQRVVRADNDSVRENWPTRKLKK